jgi:hypothetical protein
MELTITMSELLIAVILATVIYLLETLLFSFRRRRNAKLESLALEEGLLKLSSEIVNLQQRIQVLEESRNGVESAEAEAPHAIYDYAIEYARQGMIAPEIADRCGISQDEARLIVALNRKRQDSCA